MPVKSKKQRTYLAINEPEVYKKFKKEEVMNKNKGGGIYKKKPKPKYKRGDFSLPKKHRTPRGGYGKYDTPSKKKVKKERKDLLEGLKEVEKLEEALSTLPVPTPGRTPQGGTPSLRPRGTPYGEPPPIEERRTTPYWAKGPRTIAIKKGGKVDISRSSKKSGGRKGAHKKTAKYGGKVDNSGQHLVAKQYGGKVK